MGRKIIRALGRAFLLRRRGASMCLLRTSSPSYLSAIALALALGGCAPVGPNYERPSAIVSPQYKEIKGWKFATPRDREPKGEWWEAVGDATLNKLESAVVISNQTILADEANYREALDLIKQARAGLYPSVGLEGDFTGASVSGQTVSNTLSNGTASGTSPAIPASTIGAQRPSISTSSRAPGAASIVKSSASPYLLTGAATANWTVDIWGQTRREIKSEESSAEQSAAALANAKLAAQSALALAYVQLRQANSLQDLLESEIKNYENALDIVKKQITTGVASPLDYISEHTLFLDAQAQLIHARVSRKESEHAIAVLMGRTPFDLTIARGKLASSIPSIPIILPSTLLERRPDIAAAERAMHAANAQIEVATAGYYPTISLSGLYGYSVVPLQAIGSGSPVWDIGLTLAQPVFDGGLTDAKVAGARKSYHAVVANYRATVLTAFQQVEDELFSIRTLGQEKAVLVQEASEAAQATEIAFKEYRAGTEPFTAVLTQQQTQLTAEQAVLAVHAELQTAAISLVVAMGGGWSVSQLPDAAKESGEPSDR